MGLRSCSGLPLSLLFTSQPQACPVGPKITLPFLHLYIYVCVCTYHVRNNYVTYIVAMRPYLLNRLRLLCVAAMSSLPQLRLQMDTEKQRQRRRADERLTESGDARSEQLNTCGAYRVTNQQSLACLSGSERRRPGWFLDMKYQTCSSGYSFNLLAHSSFLDVTRDGIGPRM